MAGPIRISILANASQARRELNSVSGATDSLGSKFGAFAKNVGRAAVTGLAVAGAAAAKFGYDSVQAASDAQQSLGATETVFGKYADKVVAHSNRAAEQVGLSANQYRESANLIGSLFRNQGVATDQLAGKTRQMVGIGADLAATFGGPTSDAVAALGSAFKGEFDPLERYGISLKQSTVNAEAMKVANVKSTSAFEALSTAQQTAAKQQATSNLILEQGARAQGAFARESDTLANRQQVLAAKFEDVQAKIGTALLPVLTDLTDWTADKVIPVLEDFGDWLAKNQDEISSLASEVGGGLVSVLKTLVDVGGAVIDFLDGVPGPVKDIGIQAGIAAAVLPRLTGALNGVKAAAQGTITNLRTAEKRTAMLGGAMRSAAGIGGMVALSEGARTTNKGLSTLANVGGGAMLGFSLAGPIGGAIGAGAGAIYSLYQNTKDSSTEFKKAEAPIGNYVDTLDAATGAITRNTRELVLNRLEQSGVTTAAQELGIATSTVLDASLGQKKALRAVNDAWVKNGSILDGVTAKPILEFIQAQRTEIAGASRRVQEHNRAMKGLDKETGKAGETTRKVNEILKKVGAERPNTGKWTKLYAGDLEGATRKTRDEAGNMAKELRDGTGKARPDLSQFNSTLMGQLDTLRGRARTGGEGVGDAMGAGINSGLGAWLGNVMSTAAGMVRDAIQAAKNEGEVKSPSRKMKKIGGYLGEGLALGMEAQSGRVRKASAQLARDVATGFSAPNLTLDARPKWSDVGTASFTPTGSTTYAITVQAAVGSSPEEIGRTLVKHIDAYERAGGRRKR